MSEIVVMGYYGYENFGDDLMLYNICNCLSNEHKLDVITRDKKNTKIPNQKNVLIHETFKRDKLKNFKLFYNIFKNKEYLLWGGGTCFSDEDRVVSPSILFMAKMMGLKIIFIGVGSGNIKTLKNRVKMKINSMLINKVYIRDIKSYDYISKYFTSKKMQLTEDLAYLYDFNTIKNNIENSITVSLRNLDNYISKELEDILITNLVNFVQNTLEKGSFSEINIIVLDTLIDYEINQKIYRFLKQSISQDIECNFISDNDFQNKIQLIQKTKFMICLRLHGIFVSELSGIKTIGIGYSPKVERFMKSINSYGYVNLIDVINGPEILEEKYKKVFENNNEINIKEFKMKALKNFDFIN